MANHKDAVKRAAQSERVRVRNRTYRTRMRNQIKKLRSLITGADTESLQGEFRQAVSIIQKLAAKGVIHRNQAARRVARLAAAVRGAATAPAPVAEPKAAKAAPKKAAAKKPAPSKTAAAKKPAAARTKKPKE